MSKIKSILPEDIDVTDIRDTGNYGEPERIEPTNAEIAMANLWLAKGSILENASELDLGDLQILELIINDLQGVIAFTRKPF